jgi:hypothetical protein
MHTALWLLPEENLGVAVVTNTHNSFLTAVVQRIVDRFLGIEDRPHDIRVRENHLQAFTRAQATRDSVHAARIPGTTPSAPLRAFTGVFEDALYGTASVRLEDGALTLRFWEDETQELRLEHWHHDTFRGTWKNPAQREKFVWFTRDTDGQIAALHVRWHLRHDVIQVGVYPAFYTRDTIFRRTAPPAGAQD